MNPESDSRSKASFQIIQAAEFMSRSKVRRTVFEEIYKGKRKGKTVQEIVLETKIPKNTAYREARYLYLANIVKREKNQEKALVYLKDRFFSKHKKKVLKLSRNKPEREKFREQMTPKLTNEVADENGPTEKIIILFLAANAIDNKWCRLNKEFREIKKKIEIAKRRDQITLINEGAVQVHCLQQFLNNDRPTIVHFSGHGTEEGKILLLDQEEKPIAISGKALASALRQLRTRVRCVVLNACYSKTQAEELKQEVDCVIGMSSSISDKAAIAFSYAFYLGLASGRSINSAFEQGKTEIMFYGTQEEDIPKLISRDDIDPKSIHLLN